MIQCRCLHQSIKKMSFYYSDTFALIFITPTIAHDICPPTSPARIGAQPVCAPHSPMPLCEPPRLSLQVCADQNRAQILGSLLTSGLRF